MKTERYKFEIIERERERERSNPTNKQTPTFTVTLEEGFLAKE